MAYDGFGDAARDSRRSSSSDQQQQQQQTPIHDAVNSAFDNSNAASQVDPALLAQITEQVSRQVLDNLKSSGFAGVSSPAPHYHPQQPPPPSQPSYSARSRENSASSFTPQPNVYTPPSPSRHDSISHGSSSPDPPAQDPNFFREFRQGSSPDSLDGTSRSRPWTARQTHPDEEETTLERIWQPLFDGDGQPTARLDQFLRGVALHIIEDYEPKHSIVITPAKMLQFYNDVKLPQEHYQWPSIFGKMSNACISRLYRELRCQHHLVQSQHEVPHIPSLTTAGFSTWMSVMIQAHPDAEFERLAHTVLSMPISNADNRRERFPKELSRRLFPRIHNLQAQQRIGAAMSSADPSITIPRTTSYPPPPPPPAQQPAQPPQMSQSFPAPPASTGSLERERAPYSTSQATSRRSVSSGSGSSDDESPPVSMPIERERKPYSAMPGAGRFYEDDGGKSSSGGSTPTASQTGREPSQMRQRSQTRQASQCRPGPTSTPPPSSQSAFAKPNGPPPSSNMGDPRGPGAGIRRANTSATTTAAPFPRPPSHASFSCGPQPPHSATASSTPISVPNNKTREHGPPPTSMPSGSFPAGGTPPRQHRRTNSGLAGPPPRFSLRSRSPTLATANPYTRSEGSGVHDIPAHFYASNLHNSVSSASSGAAFDDDELGGGLERSASNGSDAASSAPRGVDPRKYAMDAARYGGAGGSVPPQLQGGGWGRAASMYDEEGAGQGGYYDRRRSMMGNAGGYGGGGWAEGGGRRYG